MKLQRDQVVAASLVGTVVVVLGFASGIGGVPLAQSTTPQTPPRTTQHEQPHPPVEHAPVVHNPVPVAHVPAPHVPAPTHPSVPPTTRTPVPPTTSEPARPCDANALTKLLRDLGLLVGDLPVVGELTEGAKAVDELPLLGLLPPLELPGGCKVVVEEKTGKVTGLLGTP